jgi:hypothetical protein
VEPIARRQLAVAAALAALMVLVVVAVFLDVRRLAGVVTPGPLTLAPAPAGTPTAGPTVAASARPGVLPTLPSGGGTLHYVDETGHLGGFRLDLSSNWRQLDTTDSRAASSEPVHVIFSNPASGARLAVTAWPGEGKAPLSRTWIQEQAPGMASVDGRWPTEAVIAGDQALIVWADEAPDVPARYAAFVRHAGNAYRVAYSASDGGALLADYARALVSLEWTDDDTTDMVPPLPRPAGRFFPPVVLAEP